MPRPKEFDRDEVLDRALEAFWTHGYEATSMQDLVEAMGIHRGSLYDTFGDKHALFLAALDRYERVWVSRVVERLEEEGALREVLRRIFDEVVQEAASCSPRRGCLTTNSAVELAPRDPRVAARVAAAFGRVEEAFCTALTRAREHGEFGGDLDPRAVARFLTSSIQGLRVLARSGAERGTLRDVVDVTLRVVG
ncbi:MAG TPA: TetR/AcrR family transcriptional regulator [Longimicrobiaceae bacterium]|nr:TetR/AcrR family transcriptional regulator [Longimicrobiaceae bacterium]